MKYLSNAVVDSVGLCGPREENPVFMFHMFLVRNKSDCESVWVR